MYLLLTVAYFSKINVIINAKVSNVKQLHAGLGYRFKCLILLLMQSRSFQIPCKKPHNKIVTLGKKFSTRGPLTVFFWSFQLIHFIYFWPQTPKNILEQRQVIISPDHFGHVMTTEQTSTHKDCEICLKALQKASKCTSS